jgi:hypothetical protein
MAQNVFVVKFFCGQHHTQGPGLFHEKDLDPLGETAASTILVSDLIQWSVA